jgi:hypothetical protein
MLEIKQPIKVPCRMNHTITQTLAMVHVMNASHLRRELADRHRAVGLQLGKLA